MALCRSLVIRLRREAFRYPSLRSRPIESGIARSANRESATLLVRTCLLLALGFTLAGSGLAQDPWLMKGHDVRRTGQSLGNGPLSINAADSWVAEVPAAHTINIGATVTQHGVFFGSWGLLRRDPDHPDPRFWDKSDGQLFGLDPATGISLWGGPLDLDLVPRCYDFQGRGPNLLWCGLTPYEVSFYNGTVEGQVAVDTSRNMLYLGRGDGKLFAIDPEEGVIIWRYETYNPQLPDDPDGGGEIVTAPLVGPEGTVYFGTWGEGPYETNAFYAVSPEGTLQWRYPESNSLTHRIFASPALSPDASTIYVSSFRNDDGALSATLYAFHREPATGATDADRLKWALTLEHEGKPIHSTTLAVGSDGTIYVGGFLVEGFGVPVLVAVGDQGGQPVLKWNMPYVELRDGAQFVLGIALREVGGQTKRVYATTSNAGTVLFNAKEEGTLYAIDPATGITLASYDPSDDVPGAVGGINSPAIGANGTVYIGVRGRFGDDAANGYYMAVDYDAKATQFVLRWHEEVDGYVEWNHPAIGPDGGLYAGSSSRDEQARTPTYLEGETPEGTTAYFYGFKGPTTEVNTENESQQAALDALGRAFPNPFSHHTRLLVSMVRAGPVQLAVYDLLGRRVSIVYEGVLPRGQHPIRWSPGMRLPGGLYIIHMYTGASDQSMSQPVLLLR